jgi:MATE family multidrug resistance protein
MKQNNSSEISAIFAIALPMILSAISVPWLGIVDTAILGHLESSIYLAAINIGTTIFNVLFWGFGFLRMSTTGLVAQSFGENNHKKIKLQLTQSTIVAFSISLFLVAFQSPIGSFALSLMSEGGEIGGLAQSYFEIRILSAPAALLIYVLSGYFLAIQQARIVLYIMLVNQVGNMILDYVFVVHLDMNIKGVAYGSIISEYLAVFVGLIFVFKNQISMHWQDFKNKEIFNLKDLKTFFSLNLDIFIRTLCLMAVFALMTKGSARLGQLSLAANAVLLNFFYLMSYGLDGFAHAVESLCGQAYGEGDKEKLKAILNNIFKISF